MCFVDHLLILTVTLKSRNYYYPHFIDVETGLKHTQIHLEFKTGKCNPRVHVVNTYFSIYIFSSTLNSNLAL